MPASPSETCRQIVLGDQRVEYTLRRSRRRTIGFAIDPRGLRISVPLRARIDDIERLIQQHARWILGKLAAWRDRQPPAALEIADGSPLTIFGQTLTVHLQPAPRNRWTIDGERLVLQAVPTVDPRTVLEKALREHARTVFTQRLALHAPRLGVTPPPLRLSSARTRWGSCNARGLIALNWRLVFMPLPVVDYVVCHELAHLREMNHSARFWAIVGELCPDWQAQRQALRQLGRQLPQL